MHKYINKKVLITTSGWFYGDDGKQYRAIHGTLKAVHEAGKTLGFIPNRSHANWFIEVGSMIVMGCQVMYMIECVDANGECVKDYHADPSHDTGIKEYERPSAIYFTD